MGRQELQYINWHKHIIIIVDMCALKVEHLGINIITMTTLNFNCY